MKMQKEIKRLYKAALQDDLFFGTGKGKQKSGSKIKYENTLFDTDFVHRIDIRLADADWSGLLSDPISKTKYAADIVIDGETFSNVTFSTKGFSSLYFVA